MNDRTLPINPFASIQSRNPLLQGCELLMQMRFGAIPDVIEYTTNQGETLSYLYNPGDRWECPIYFPKSEKWCVQSGRVWLRFTERGKIVVEFEDDLTPALRISFKNPEEVIEFVEFLEVASHENLALHGDEETNLESWFASFSKEVPSKINADAKQFDPVRGLRLYFRPGQEILSPISMLSKDMESLDCSYICAERNPDASLLETMDLLQSPEGTELINSIRLGPDDFRKKANSFFLNRKRGLTPFLQSRNSIAKRSTREHSNVKISS